MRQQQRLHTATAALAGLTVCGAAISSVRADVIAGGEARSIAMGGAGLAVAGGTGGAFRLNPASLATSRRGGLEMPSVGLRSRGIGLGEVSRRLRSGTADESDAAALARDFGSRDGEIGLTAGSGLRFGAVEATVSGVARVRLLPNDALKSWAKNGNGDVSLLPANARADLVGAAVYSLPAISVAGRVSKPQQKTALALGARFQQLRAVYSHYVADADAIQNDTDAATAPEIPGGKDYLSKSGLGVDVGLLAYPASGEGVSLALVVDNLIGPSLRFDGTLPGTEGALRPVRYNLRARSVSVGTAWQSRKGVIALDLVDLNRAYGAAQVRLGGEVKAGPLALRAGVAGGGFTYGVGLGPVSVAFGGRTPFAIGQTIRF